MHKIIESIKICLTGLLTFLTIKYIITYGIEFNNFINYCIIYFVFIVMMIGDYIKKNNIQKNKKYNILVIITFTVISFIFIRTLYDKSLLSNSKEYLSSIGLISENMMSIFGIEYYSMFYLYQNITFFVLMIIGLFIYREVNIKEKNKKYNRVSIVCLSLTFLVFSSEIFSENLILLMICNVIFIITETWSLVIFNHRRREWTVYVGWFWHTLTIIGIIFDLFS